MKHNLEKVKNILARKQDLFIDNMTVVINTDHNTLGNGTWGKLDYLVKQGYNLLMLSASKFNLEKKEFFNNKNKKNENQ